MNSQKTSKKILILSAPYGSGHTRAAEALKAHLEVANNTVMHFDILSLYKKNIQKGLQFPYFAITKSTPKLYGFVYQHMHSRLALRRYMRSLTPLVKHKQKEILKLILEYAPDYIVCTHFTAGHVLSILEKKGHVLPPHYIQITDYTYHPLWYSEYARGYFLASHDVQVQMEYEGFDRALLHTTGIPVDPVFTAIYQQTTIKQTLNLPNVPLYLIMTGGQGLVDPSDIVTYLQQTPGEKRIIIITGKNESLEESLRATYKVDPSISVVGWTDQIHTYMQAADVVCTKPGGITITECLTLQKPMIIYKPIPGQELANTDYLLRNNLALLFSKDIRQDVLPQIKKLAPWCEQFTAFNFSIIE